MNTAQKIAKESIISFTGIFYGSLNRYLYSALLARWVGPEYLGIYSMANAIMLISEVLSKMGMETGVMRFISRLDPKNDRDEIFKLYKSELDLLGHSYKVISGKKRFELALIFIKKIKFAT